MQVKYFIKEYGLQYSKDVLKNAPSAANYVEWYPMRSRFYMSNIGCNRAVCLVELQRIVESHEILFSNFESVEIAEYEYMISDCYSEPFWLRIKQAIKDVQECKL